MLEDHAEELGVVERDGKLQIPAPVWAFVFGFAAGESRTLAAFRRSYNSTTDKTLTAGGFYQRLTPLLTDYLCDLVERRIDEVAVPHIGDEFDRFRDIVVADGTILSISQSIAS
jgi:putative transposase